MGKRLSGQTFLLESRPRVAGFASVAGEKERQGPLGHTFDETFTDDYLGMASWEKAEAHMLERTADFFAPDS